MPSQPKDERMEKLERAMEALWREHASLKAGQEALVLSVDNLKEETFKAREVMKDIFTALMGSLTDKSKVGLISDYERTKADLYAMRPIVDKAHFWLKVGGVLLPLTSLVWPLVVLWVKHEMGW